MDAALKGRIKKALKVACAPDERPEIRLYDAQGASRVSGYVRSSRFAGMTPSERQDLLWAKLDAELSPDESTRITFIMAETPDEHAELAAFGAALGAGVGRAVRGALRR